MMRLLLLCMVLCVVSGLRWSTSRVRSVKTQLCDLSPRSPRDVETHELSKLAKKFVLPSLLVFLGVGGQQAANAAGTGKTSSRTEYLKEPTEEFSAEVSKTKALRAAGEKTRKEFDAILAKFVASTEPKDLAKYVAEMTKFIDSLDGIPQGLKKQELVKACRSKKFIDPKARIQKTKPEWTKEVEIEYQKLILVFNKKVNPDNKVDRT